jgi:signal transduction histidine kinase
VTRSIRVVRALVIVAGVAATIAGACALRLEDWPIYVVFVLLSIVFYPLSVEMMPGLRMPMPELALTIGFLYVGGLPIVLLRNLAPPFLKQVTRLALLERWRARIWIPHEPGRTDRGRKLFAGLWEIPRGERAAAAADWALLSVGLAARWVIASWLAPDGRLVSHPGAMLAAEIGGYACWAAISALPILSFQPVLPLASHSVTQDMGLIMIPALTPFVFLIAYGYATQGLPGATVWSLSSLGLHFILQGLTERRKKVEAQNQQLAALNRELEHRERLSAIGKMSSVVSHQMLQQLGIIRLYADLIRNADAAGDPAAAVSQAKRNAAAIDEALTDVNRVLTDLLVFSRDLRLHLYGHQLEAVIAESVDECRPQAASRGVRLRAECSPGPAVTCDKLKVKQAVVNVLRNAIEASPSGEEVAVRAGVQDGWAVITISDRGPGVPAADREAVFTPFFSTKDEGTGLGLAIAREFTRAHGGQISVDGGGGRGATFVIRLPTEGPLPAPEV